MISTFKMPQVDIPEICRELAETGKQVNVLWQEDESLVFIARGRDYRSEFHINPSDEVMYQVSGSMNLHYRTPEGREDVTVLKAGEVVFTAAGVPHSPRFPSDTFLMVIE